ncbi:MAG TPA: GTPase Era [Candidatus Scatosoma pullistercoris]|uniref:GTPase Era n=1 Tax=Candidatus Scatosoma pullistercoris TaxID=2840934 RepID=A0A9D1MFU7_9FIRM|nr:GTPase Era [Candidatus Scatosoma pullistercoris]
MRSGYVAVIGRANAGKSTLINVMVGEKVSIVSPKPQTTRDRILGVLTKADYQIVFVDTPGIYKAKNTLTDRMMRTTEESAKSVDFLLYVLDGHEGVRDEDFALINKYKALGIPMAVAYTKIDIMPRENIPPDMAKFADSGVDLDVFPVSARKGTNIRKLEEFLVSRMPEGEKVFEQEIVSDKSERFMIAEIMREKILLKYDKEIPHGVAIVINTFRRGENGVYEISLDIVCEKPGHKAILIGKQGRAIKEVSSFARRDMEKFLSSKVFLTTYVKVKEEWRDRPDLLKEYGYEEYREE